jgi:hypothetical protein
VNIERRATVNEDDAERLSSRGDPAMLPNSGDCAPSLAGAGMFRRADIGCAVGGNLCNNSSGDSARTIDIERTNANDAIIVFVTSEVPLNREKKVHRRGK